MMSAAEAATRLGLSRWRTTELAEREGIGQRVGRTWVFTEADVRKLQKARRPTGAAGHRRA